MFCLFLSPCRLVRCPVVLVSQDPTRLARFSGMNHCYQYNISSAKHTNGFSGMYYSSLGILLEKNECRTYTCTCA